MTYTVTVDVHDLEPTGPVPPNAELRIRRVYPDASGPQVVSTREHAITVGLGPVQVPLTAGIPYEAHFTGVSGWETPFTFVGLGPVQVPLTGGIPYEAHFTGVSGWETPFTFVGTADTSIAELYRSHQVDPTSLQPVTSPTLAALLALTDNGDGTATLA